MVLRKTYSSSLALLLKGICNVPSALDTHVSGIAIDSRAVKKGDVFLAVSGIHSKSTDHIKEAISKGANAVVAEGFVNKGKAFEDGLVVELFVDNLKEKVGIIADRFFRSPSSEMSVIGVTGTNGKTSVTNYLASYFAHGGSVSGVIGTLGYGIVSADSTSLKETGFTTPSVVDVHRYLAELRDLGAENVFMEVSSHGLSQGRVDGVKFEGAVFTNLTREHLDYHGSMENYAASKAKLFSKEGLKFAVINEDDEYSHPLIKLTPPGVNVLTYGVDQKADISVLKCQLNTNSESTISADISTPSGDYVIKSGLIGLFNLSNLLAVLSVAVAKQDLMHCEKRLQLIHSVSGRLQLVKQANKALVIVDYAHTPDALKNVLQAVRPHCVGKVFLVFGCGGDRDIGKRKEMAILAEKLADSIIVTDDNPRTETPSVITDHIFEGFSSKENVTLEHNREKAIQLAITKATKEDLVLIAGKGHETWQEINGQKFHFSDLEVVKRHLGIDVLSADTKEVLV